MLDQDDIYGLTSYLLTAYPVTGGLEQFAPYGSLTTEAYPLSYIAVQYLLGRSGLSVSALGDFYRAVANGSSIDGAFVSAFGIPLAGSYVAFDAWRASLQTASDFPRDFLAAPTGSIGRRPQTGCTCRRRSTGEVELIVVVTTTPGANCWLDLQFTTGTIERDTFANGEGEAFWLVTIPDDVPVGPATLQRHRAAPIRSLERSTCGDLGSSVRSPASSAWSG